MTSIERLPVPSPYAWRQLREADAGALAGFYNDLSSDSKRTFRPLGPRTDPQTCVEIARGGEAGDRFDIVLLYEGRIVGWCFLWDIRKDRPSFGLGLADAHQGKGLGKAMMSAVMHHAEQIALPEVHLIAVKDNTRAVRLYESFGFAICGERFDQRDGLWYHEMKAEPRKSRSRHVT